MSPSLLTNPGCNQLSPGFPPKLAGGPGYGVPGVEYVVKPDDIVKYPFVETYNLSENVAFCANVVGKLIGVII